ncbi:MAG: hypothetical protein ACREA9_03940 [Pyrinomonadaceae bacterium]
MITLVAKTIQAAFFERFPLTHYPDFKVKVRQRLSPKEEAIVIITPAVFTQGSPL